MLALIVDDKTKHQFLKLSHTLQILRHIQLETYSPLPLTHSHLTYMYVHTHTHTQTLYV